MGQSGCILSADESDEYYTDERCHILELSNSTADEDLSIARARVEPGVATRLHCVAGTTERYVVQQGTGRVSVAGLPDADVQVGDVVVIPPGAAQSVVNTGDVDLIFLCVCTPRFEWDNYESLE